MRHCSKLLFGAALLIAGCVDPAYDFNRINNEITLGGEALALPLGTTSKLTVADFLDDKSAEFLFTDADGKYSIRLSDSWVYDGAVPDMTKYLCLAGLNASTGATLTGTSSFGFFSDYEIAPRRFISDDLIRVTSMEMDEMPIKLVIDIKNLPALSSSQSLVASLDIKFSDRVSPGTISVSEEFTSSHFEKVTGSIKAVDLTGINFKETNSVVISASANGSLSFKGGTPSFSAIPTASIRIEMDEKFAINKLTGYTDYVADGMVYEMKFTDIPEALKDGSVVLDMTNPYILLDVNGNTGVPARGKLEVAGSEVEFDVPVVKDPTKRGSTKLFIADEDKLRPEGYAYYKAGIRSILKDVPEKVDFHLSGAAKTNEEFIMQRDANYDLKADYQVVIPLSFGKDFKAETSMELDIDESTSKYLEGMTFILGGSITNSLPLDMDLAVDFFGPLGEPIALKKPINQHIASCGPDGQPTTTDFEMSLEKAGEQDVKIANAELHLKVTSGNAAGIPLTKDSYVQAKLNVRIPGGLTTNIDL